MPMKGFELIRITKDLTKPQRGVITYEGEPLCLSLELPWKDNKPNISCIPEKEYVGRKTYNRMSNGGARFPTCIELLDVPDRAGILIHPGNTELNTQGCILPGLTFGTIYNLPAVLQSRKALERWLGLLKDGEIFSLKVRHA